MDFDLSPEETRFIPLRLTEHERTLLSVIQGALDVSEYTDNVDVSSNNYFARQAFGKTERVVEELKDLCQIITGLGIANDYKTTGQKLLAGKESAFDNEDFIADCMEVGRRFKIMNPDKMRSTYGKLIFILMDAQSPIVRRELDGLKLHKPLKTVHSTLKDAGCLHMLHDPLLRRATKIIVTDNSAASGSVDSQLKARKVALMELIEKYSHTMATDNMELEDSELSSPNPSPTPEQDLGEKLAEDNDSEVEMKLRDTVDEIELKSREVSAGDRTPDSVTLEPVNRKPLKAKVNLDLTPDLITLIVDSILDNFSFLQSNLTPVIKLISYLKQNFDPAVQPVTSFDSLEIRQGRNGSCLSHSHAMQFNFALQSLTLWKNILRHFFQAWIRAEDDLLNAENGYRLMNTGQGLQRCQEAPNVSRFMSGILSKTKNEIRSQSETFDDVEAKVSQFYHKEWVGLSVVHLGDRDVPNALVYIDKYTQVSRILTPLVQALDRIEIEFQRNVQLRNYVEKEFRGKETLKKVVLGDYFRHGFDGSGDDGGSCIDGRLTSSWNWCSKLEKKTYYPVFLLAGFLGFDGDFRE